MPHPNQSITATHHPQKTFKTNPPPTNAEDNRHLFTTQPIATTMAYMQIYPTTPQYILTHLKTIPS